MKGTVAIFIPTIYKTGRHRYIQHLSERLAKMGYHTFCFCTYSDLYWQDNIENNERDIFELYSGTEIKAAVLYTELIKDVEFCEKMVRDLSQRGIPVFTVERPISNAFNIIYDHGKGLGRIVDHVIEKHGAKNIYMLSGMRDNAFSEARNEAYRESLESHGIAFDESKIYYGDFWDVPAKKAVEQMLQDARELPEAIICANDVMAISTCIVLGEHGIRVPEDVIVTGYDGTERGRTFYPSLTTSEPDYYSSAEYICNVIGKYESGEAVSPETITFGGTFSEGMSCGCEAMERRYSSAVFADQYEEFMGQKLLRYDNDRMMLRNIGRNNLESMLGELSYNLSVMKIPGVELYLDTFHLGKPKNGHTKRLAASFHETLGLKLPFTEAQKGKICTQELLAHGNPILFLPLFGNERNYGYAAASLKPGNIVDCEKVYDLVMHLNVLLSSIETYVKLNELYVRDQLTGLLNRRGFYQELEGVLERAQSQQRSLWIISADMNGLKYINDTYGHAEGDFAITAAGRVLAEAVGEDGICARFGGDEYVAVMTELTQERLLHDAILEGLERLNGTAGKAYRISMSVGVAKAEAGRVRTDLTELIRKADKKMYLQKQENYDRRRE